jgi:glycogen phosphorylase
MAEVPDRIPPLNRPHPDIMRPLVPRTLPAGIEPLNELAIDLRWTWSHASDELWRTVDAAGWELLSNPWVILQNVTDSQLQLLAGDARFREEIARITTARREYLADPGWFGRAHPGRPLSTVAYFSMEFGLGEALPLYAGGLGVLAGDFVKTASDLGVPMVAVGLLYHEGYFRQMLAADGEQIEAYPYNDPLNLPIFPVRNADGGWLRVPLELPGRTLMLRLWHVHVGRVSLYLLDSNDPVNSAADRGITSKLYDAAPDRRLLQEMVLGIGGWRALEALGYDIDVCHLNEGHPGFVVLERARSFMARTERSFDTARCATRAGNVLTTHTPVAAGLDRFAPEAMIHYFSDYADQLEITIDELLALGRADPRDTREPFNMAFLAARSAGWINAVSRLHLEVTRRLAAPMLPRWPLREVPIHHITNGVHASSWDSEWADELWTRSCGKGRWLGTLEDICEKFCCSTDAEIWEVRNRQRHHLVEYSRARLARQLGERGADPAAIERARLVLDPHALTLGFARRITEYKRPGLILTDPARLERILLDHRRPVQFIIAGKAHPADTEGKRLVQQLATFVQRPEVRSRFVFLEDYDITTAQHLVQGVDVWINTPRRPWEACGTSGMKVLVNGGLNLSELDGWWAEAYAPEYGWAIGDRREHDTDPAWDAAEAAELYRLLEAEVVPQFYDRDAGGIPRAWIARIRASMSRLTPEFSSNRMLREYTERAYLPAAAALRDRVANGEQLAREINAWDQRIRREWWRVAFIQESIEPVKDGHRFHVSVHLGVIEPDAVQVELYAEPIDGTDVPIRIAMACAGKLPNAANSYLFEATAPAARPAADFTPRVVPNHPGAQVPLENPCILWLK